MMTASVSSILNDARAVERRNYNGNCESLYNPVLGIPGPNELTTNIC